jgi:predicted nucleic acid-binding protein
MSSYIVDANILVRLAVDDPPQQTEKAERFLDQLTANGITGVVPATVVLEIVFTLERQYSVPRPRIVDAIKEMMHLDGLRFEFPAQMASALVTYQERRSLSFADAFHCALAVSFHNGAIVSFDRKLSGVPGINRIEP